MERSPTAEDLFKDSRKVEAKSCGTGILARKGRSESTYAAFIEQNTKSIESRIAWTV